jgi:hypothetical protein
MKDFLLVLLIICTVVLGLCLLLRGQPPQDTHIPILKDSVYAPPKRAADCDPSEMSLECNGAKPR